MKKILFVLSTLVLSLTACADWHNDHATNQLPLQAETFIKKFFSFDDIIRIEVEVEHMQREYDVYFNDGTKLEFDKQGNFLSVDCLTREVPAAILPEAIVNYVETHFPQLFITEYSVKSRHLTVELNNETELIFDLEGNFLRMDD